MDKYSDKENGPIKVVKDYIELIPVNYFSKRVSIKNIIYQGKRTVIFQSTMIFEIFLNKLTYRIILNKLTYCFNS